MSIFYNFLGVSLPENRALYYRAIFSLAGAYGPKQTD